MTSFMDIEISSYDESSVVMLPVPYEGTVTYGKGTSKGPQAILDASQFLETYDDEAGDEVDVKIHVLEPLQPAETPEKMVEAVYKETKKLIEACKFVIMLGGEHSLPAGTVKAFNEEYERLSVLQFDSHTDLRDEYSGTKFSHGTVMSRIREMCPAVQLGIRSLSKEEADKVERWNLPVFFAKDMVNNDDWMEKAISKLSKNVYITFDVDVFDPSIMPATGTPEPGGLDWYTITRFLKKVFTQRNVVGFDVVELAPIEGLHHCDFTVAKLIQKMIVYKFC